jgi:hypothetical protein
MRQLKHHEQKLLRKVSLFSWKGEDNIRVAKILRRYHIQNREDYVAYSKICGMVTKLAAKLKVGAVVCRAPWWSGLFSYCIFANVRNGPYIIIIIIIIMITLRRSPRKTPSGLP